MNSALLIHAGALGDFILSLTVVNALRHRGASHVAVLGRTHAKVALRFGAIDGFIDIEHGGWHALFAADGIISDAARCTLSKFATIVDMAGVPDGAVVRNLRCASAARIASIDPRPRPGLTGHITEQWLTDLAAQGVNATASAPLINVLSADLAAARRVLIDAVGHSSHRICVLHPGSGSRTKCWPVHQFIDLSDRLDAVGYSPVYMIGPVEREQMEIEARQDLGRLRPTLPPCTLADAAALLAAADLYVGNDSGISHLAAAVGAPIVAVFGPTDPRVWRPLGPHVRTVIADSNAVWPTVDQILDETALLRNATSRRDIV